VIGSAVLALLFHGALGGVLLATGAFQGMHPPSSLMDRGAPLAADLDEPMQIESLVQQLDERD
jgi:hypothetical protein